MVDKLAFNKDGDLIIPKSKLGDFASLSPKQMRMMKISGDLIISSSPHPGMRSQPFFYGDLRLFHVAELLALISSMGKEGKLIILVPHARKAIYFKRGHVVHAASSVEDDRLGEILWRKGIISLTQLSETSEQVAPGKKIGKLLIDKGIITPRQLYEGIQEQVLEIVYSTFHFNKGEFIFEEEKLGRKFMTPPELSTRELIQAGLARLDELTRLENIFTDRQTVLSQRPLHLDMELNEHEKYVKSLVDSKRTVEQIIDESRLVELETLRALSKLLNTGQVDVAKSVSGQTAVKSKFEDPIEELAHKLKLIFSALITKDKEFGDRLNAYLSFPPKRYKDIFDKIALDHEGEVDIKKLRENAKRMLMDKKDILAAMDAFYDYAMFQALEVLDEKSYDELTEKLKED